jgi:hypothetical protein
MRRCYKMPGALVRGRPLEGAYFLAISYGLGRRRFHNRLVEETCMLTTVEGIYRDGKIELLETPPDVKEARVVITFLPIEGNIDLWARGISEAEAAEIRSRWGAAAEDWDRPEMDVYNEKKKRRDS